MAAWHEYLKAIVVDEAPMSREVALRILQEFSQSQRPEKENSPYATLTAREKETLEWVAKGKSNREISYVYEQKWMNR